ncbi:MAG: SCO family protein, partial [Sphingobacterium sp.]
MSNNTRSKNISKLIILALVLFVPGFLYIMVNKMGSNEYVKLPVFGEKHLSGKMNRVMGREIPDTVFHHLEPIEFTNYNGNQVTFLGTDTTITVAHLFYSKDQGLSKQLIADLNGVANRFIANPQIKFFSISVD